MKVTGLHLTNIKCFPQCDLSFSPSINVVVGANNSGKSSILNCIGVLQQPRLLSSDYSRVRSDFGTIKIDLDQTTKAYFHSGINNAQTTTNRGDNQYLIDSSMVLQQVGFLNVDPDNFIVPFQSRRKVPGFSEGITSQEVNQVTGTLSNLYAKIDRISNPEFEPAYSKYIKACDDILGFRVTTSNSANGKKGVYIIRNTENIPIDTMGEGVANVLGLIVDLCLVETRLFLIEEPENDIHPKALKKLLGLIVRSSDQNQFIITTHSNIVVRYLAAVSGAKLFTVDMSLIEKIPTSIVQEVNSPEMRRQVLEDLGYDMFDVEVWDYWILLEESSAERIIREFIIPWFFPELSGRVRTYSAGSVSQVEKKFSDFNDLFVFLHLQPIYRNKAFVIVDGGENESKIVQSLIKMYGPSGWEESCFSQFDRHDFELYYPERFQSEVESALTTSDKQERRVKKSAVLRDLVEWAKANPETAKNDFSESFAEVIDRLGKVLRSDREA